MDIRSTEISAMQSQRFAAAKVTHVLHHRLGGASQPSSRSRARRATQASPWPWTASSRGFACGATREHIFVVQYVSRGRRRSRSFRV
eukprot:1777990-Pyramimonas_sp.AAC.1